MDNKEWEDSLRRAFVNREASYIVFDGHTARNVFLNNALSYGKAMGWLEEHGPYGDEQWTEYHFYLTESGKKHFGLVPINELRALFQELEEL